jgi:hypothetical protein
MDAQVFEIASILASEFGSDTAATDPQSQTSTTAFSTLSSSNVPTRKKRGRTSPIWDYTPSKHRDDMLFNEKAESI